MQEPDADARRYSFGGFILDIARGELSRDGVAVQLRPKAFEVLRHLVEHPGRLVGKRELLDTIWGRRVVTEGALSQCLIEIRRALGPEHAGMVRTVARRGVILEAEVAPLVPDPSPPQAISGAGPVAATGPIDEVQEHRPPAEQPLAARRSPAASSGPRWITTAVLTAVAAAIVAAVLLWRSPGAERVAATPDATAALSVGKRVAVLRFLDLSPEGNNGYLADGLGEEILHLLAQSPELEVVARSSSFAYGPGEVDVATVARELGVSHVIEGSVRRAGDTLRVTAQLIDAGTGLHLWSRTYDREAGDVLRLQREIATDVAQELEVALVPGGMPNAERSAQAHELFLHGRHLFHRRGPGDLEAAEQYLRQAVEVDPGHARAWTLLAGTYAARADDELGDPAYRLDDQRDALERALAVDPDLAEAHVRLSRYAWQAGDAELGRASLERAYRLAPDDPLVLASRGAAAVRAGRLEEATEFAARNAALDPLSAVYRLNFGYTLLGVGRYEEGLAQLRRAGALSPGSMSQGIICQALVLLGRLDEARRDCAALPPGPESDKLRLLVGDPGQARAAGERLAAAGTPQALLMLAEAAAYRGDTADAWEWLGATVKLAAAGPHNRPFDAIWFDVETSPFLRPLREDPRWGYWRRTVLSKRPPALFGSDSGSGARAAAPARRAATPPSTAPAPLARGARGSSRSPLPPRCWR